MSAAKHKCDKCEKEFGNAWGLKVHISKAHRDKPAVVKRKKRTEITVPAVHFCPNCGANLLVIARAMAVLNMSGGNAS